MDNRNIVCNWSIFYSKLDKKKIKLNLCKQNHLQKKKNHLILRN